MFVNFSLNVEQIRRHCQRLDARRQGLEKLHARLLREESAEQERVAQKEQGEFAGRCGGNAHLK